MYKHLLLLLSFLLVLGCSTPEETAIQDNGTESLAIGIRFEPESNIAQTINSASVFVFYNDSLIIEETLLVTDSTIEGVVEKLTGNLKYKFVLSVYNNEGNTIYEGSAEATIISGKNTNVDIDLYATTGNAIITGKIIDDNNGTNPNLILSLSSATGVEDITKKSVLTNNGVTLTDTGFTFDGNDDYIACNNAELFNVNKGDFTIEFSIITAVQDAPIFSKYRGLEGGGTGDYIDGGVGSRENGWAVQVENSGSYNGIRFDISDGANGMTGLLSSGSIVFDNQWHDIKIVYAPSKELASMYVDGKLIDTASIVGWGPISNDNDLYLGWRGDYWFHFNGAIDNIKIHNIAL